MSLGQNASKRTCSRPARPKMVRLSRSVIVNPQKLHLYHRLHAALEEFFDPLRTNNSRADFFAVYRKQSNAFDREYMRKYDEGLNTSPIPVSHPMPILHAGRYVLSRKYLTGRFSAVSSAFIFDIQSKLEPDPNERTAAYIQILIHAVNGSLFPDADSNAATWAGPPSDVVQYFSTQSLLYAILVTSPFTSFMAMLGKQWINLHLRNRGGSNVQPQAKAGITSRIWTGWKDVTSTLSSKAFRRCFRPFCCCWLRSPAGPLDDQPHRCRLHLSHSLGSPTTSSSPFLHLSLTTALPNTSLHPQ